MNSKSRQKHDIAATVAAGREYHGRPAQRQLSALFAANFDELPVITPDDLLRNMAAYDREQFDAWREEQPARP